MVADNKTIGLRIKERREALNISQEKLGEMLGVTYQQIQKYEKGINKVSAERLAIIAKYLKISVGFFFDRADEFRVGEKLEEKNYSIRGKRALSHQERDLINCFRSLPDKKAQTNLLAFLRAVCKDKEGP